MRSFYERITRHPRLVVAVFLILALIGGWLRSFVPVNYNMADYLPQESPSSLALDVMTEEYDGGIPNARVMVEDVLVAEALALKQQLAEIDGVEAVTWLDDAADVLEPLETLDADLVAEYYKDGAALYSITIADGEYVAAVNAIRALVGENAAMSGDAVSTAVATQGTISEIQRIAVVAVAFVLAVLFLTTTSWLEPLLVLAGLGVAILINMGSNLIFGEISFVTNAAGAVLQMAVSLDYSVFLIHRFEECLRDQDDPRAAMVDALCLSTSSILSSGLTTVIGFFALVFMQFRIGPDLGLALAKGIAISLITVFVFTPALVLLTWKGLARTKHPRFLPDFHKLGRVVVKTMGVWVLLAAIIVVPCYLASGANSYNYGASHIYGPGTELGEDTEAILARFGQSDTYVLMVPRGDPEAEQHLSAALKNLHEVESVQSYADTVGQEIPSDFLPEDTRALLLSDDYSRFVLTVDAAYEGDATFDLVERVRAVAQQYYPDQYHLAGQGVTAYDLMDTITQDTVKVNLIAVAAVFVVLLLTMRSLSLPFILVLSIETAIWINFAIPYFSGTTIFYIAYLIVSSVQLGATVDYAILFTERYIDLRVRLDKRAAIVETVAVVTPSVITSGSVLVIVGFLLSWISSHGVLSELGHFIGVGSLLSLMMVLFVLPGLLVLCDRLIARTTKNITFYESDKEASIHANS